VQQLRDRLLEREHTREDVDRAIDLLLESKALDDARVAAAYVRTAVKVKGRGRLRIQRELQTMGIGKDVAAEALAEVFGEVDERTLIAKALQKKVRNNQKIATPAEYARVFQFLMRQGFSPAGVTAALRRHRKGSDPLE
jgi:SOS response regulatory protein OraA/RecX